MSGRMPAQHRSISMCALVPYPPDTTPSQRFRVEQWMPYLRSQGISVDLVPFANRKLAQMLHQPGRWVGKAVACTTALVRRLLAVAAIPSYDAVLIHRAACLAGPAVLERLLTRFRRPVIFDFDDAIFLLHTTEANRRFAWLKCPGKTATICRLSTHVVVGNSYLAEYAVRYNPRVTVVPTSIDTERYRPTPRHRPNGRVVVGWTGSATSQAHLELFAPVLHRLVARRDVALRIVSNREPTLPGIPFIWRPWSAESEVAEFACFDIGIMPMPDDQWSRGKCALKALQYMAMGIPAVCSPVGANCEVIRHGENGLLAATPEDWLLHLEALIDDPTLREKLGREGRKTVEQRYSRQRCASLFAGVVREAIGERDGPRPPGRGNP